MPIRIEAMGVTKPEAGVIATIPATAPEAAPTALVFLVCIQEMSIQVTIAAQVAVLVTTKALDARKLAPRALPALNPNQPNQRRPAPRTTKGTLCAGMGSWPWPLRLPTTRAAASAAMPALTWTTVP